MQGGEAARTGKRVRERLELGHLCQALDARLGQVRGLRPVCASVYSRVTQRAPAQRTTKSCASRVSATTDVGVTCASATRCAAHSAPSESCHGSSSPSTL